MTGVMMSIPPVDFQTHNSLFLVSHFHNVIIGGVLFGFFAGLSYWFPKVFGFMLDERRGKYAFWLWVSGFYLAFMPLYPLGLMGAMRRNYHFENIAYKPYLWVAALGAALIFLGFLCQVWQLVYSIKHKESLRDKTGDPWDGRTLEWSLSSPAPFYNFAHIPEVSQIDDYWYKKQAMRASGKVPPVAADHYEDIHMPRSTSAGFLISLFAALFGFSAIWHMIIPGIIGLLGVIAVVVFKSFNLDTDYYVKASEVEEIENAFIKEAHS